MATWRASHKKQPNVIQISPIILSSQLNLMSTDAFLHPKCSDFWVTSNAVSSYSHFLPFHKDFFVHNACVSHATLTTRFQDHFQMLHYFVFLFFGQALELVTVIVGRKATGDVCKFGTCAEGADAPLFTSCNLPSSDNVLQPGKPLWANYVKGVIENFPTPIPGFDAMIASSVPLGGGLSSSASLEVAVFTFLEHLCGKEQKDLKEKALACQKAEHKFANMPCGIMDQFISVMGKKGNALLLDCRYHLL